MQHLLTHSINSLLVTAILQKKYIILHDQLLEFVKRTAGLQSQSIWYL